MKTIELNILAEDIRNTDFYKSKECALTKALKRANIDAVHTGFTFVTKNDEHIESPQPLVDKILEMYRFMGKLQTKGVCTEPQDFTFSLEVPDNW